MDIHTLIIIGFYLIILLYSVIVHEIAHGLMALRLGDRTALVAGRLTLNPKSHIDPLGSVILPIAMLFLTGFRFAFGWARPVPFDPYALRDGKWGPVWVALAGPLTNFALAAGAALIARVLPVASVAKVAVIDAVFRSDWTILTQMVSGSLATILFLFCAIIVFWNVLLGIFNLIPLPPLDGSKLLYALVPVSLPTRAFLERYGFFLLLALVLFFPQSLNTLLSVVWSAFFALAV